MKRKKIANHIVFIVGMHRSGTSLFTNILYKLGYGIDEKYLIQGNFDNRKGFFESKKIVELNNSILNFNHIEHNLVKKIIKFNFTQSHKTQAKNIIKELLLSAKKEVIFLKDPRFSLLLPFWHEVCYELNLKHSNIVVYRHYKFVCDSLFKRNVMAPIYSKLLTLFYYVEIFKSYNDANFQILNINNFLLTPKIYIKKIFKNLKLDYDEKKLIQKFQSIFNEKLLTKNSGIDFQSNYELDRLLTKIEKTLHSSNLTEMNINKFFDNEKKAIEDQYNYMQYMYEIKNAELFSQKNFKKLFLLNFNKKKSIFNFFKKTL